MRYSSLQIRFARHETRSYEIIFGSGIRAIPGIIRREHPGVKIFVLTDSNVGKIYGRHFRKEYFTLITIPAGESNKNRKTKNILEDKLIASGIRRDSLIVALGGGMVGDISGFVASTIFRGIPYIQIPTSLLAQVDSSIGGKVGVNHPAGKNLIGSFHQPERVYIDVATLKTLPDAEFKNGMAEVIKYGAALDRRLFSYIENNQKSIMKKNKKQIIHIVRRCCELKKYIVEKDEKEWGVRRILNFGHTIGHAVESLSKFRLSHGESVSIGMAAEAGISVASGFLESKDARRLTRLLTLYDLPVKIPYRLSVSKVVQKTLYDKKNLSGCVQYTLLEKIGKARAGSDITADDALRFIRR